MALSGEVTCVNVLAEALSEFCILVVSKKLEGHRESVSSENPRLLFESSLARHLAATTCSCVFFQGESPGQTCSCEISF